jgi:LEA14-like dessication related protein
MSPLSMRQHVFPWAPVAALLAALAALASCAGIEKPEVTLSGVEVKGLSADGVSLALILDVENPNTFGADIGELTYTVYLDDTRVATGVQDEKVPLPAGGTTEVSVPFTILWKGVDKSVRKLLDGEKHAWRLKGRVKLSKGPLAKTFSFAERGEFVAPKASDVKIDIGL